jgi:hypothetical protein
LSRAFLVAAGIVVAAFVAWSWVSQTTELRYRLIVDVEVDGQVYRGSGVWAVRFEAIGFPEMGSTGGARAESRTNGDAIVVEIGQRGPLFVTLAAPPTNVVIIYPYVESLAFVHSLERGLSPPRTFETSAD